jgi:hypothetical protein
MTMKKILSLCTVLALCACATSEGSAEVTFSTFVQASIAYDGLPPCSTTKTEQCSRRSIVAQIKESRNAAYDSLRIARAAGISDSITMAQGAVKVFTDLMAMPEIQAAIAPKQ